MKKTSNQQTLKQAIDRLIRAYGLGERMERLDLIDSWEELMGKAIARRTTDLFFKNGTLTVKLDSSVLREELMMGKTEIMRMLNEKAGKELVRDMVFR